MSDVVVTGVGVVSPIGIGTQAFWDALVAGRSGAAPIQSFDASDQAVRFACEVNDFDPTEFMSARDANRADRFTQFSAAAASMAWEASGLDKDDLAVPPERVGAIVGTGMTGLLTYEHEHASFMKGGPRRVSPLVAVKMMGNAASANVTMTYGLMGPSYSVLSACATGANAIGDAFLYIKSGMADIMVAGASEAGISPFWTSAYTRMGALSKRNEEPEKASRPFDAERAGFVMGEGAALMVLERREVAEKRGATILAELAGYGANSDAYHLSQPHPEGKGAVFSMRQAMATAGLDPEDVDLINPHGTGTTYNDRAETLAIKEVFGHEAKRLGISATKSQIGHLMGAAGAVEAAATILSIQHGIMPGTINLTNPDPELDLDYLVDGPREHKIRAALSNSFGLGGHCGCLAFKAA